MITLKITLVITHVITHLFLHGWSCSYGKQPLLRPLFRKKNLKHCILSFHTHLEEISKIISKCFWQEFKGLKSCIFKKLNFSWTSPYFRVCCSLKKEIHISVSDVRFIFNVWTALNSWRLCLQTRTNNKALILLRFSNRNKWYVVEKSLNSKYSTFTSAFISSFLPVKNEPLWF